MEQILKVTVDDVYFEVKEGSHFFWQYRELEGYLDWSEYWVVEYVEWFVFKISEKISSLRYLPGTVYKDEHVLNLMGEMVNRLKCRAKYGNEVFPDGANYLLQ